MTTVPMVLRVNETRLLTPFLAAFINDGAVDISSQHAIQLLEFEQHIDMR
jgi:hypothetical protein